MVALPVVWTGLEFFRAHFLTGFAWYFLGHTQHAFLALIQINLAESDYNLGRWEQAEERLAPLDGEARKLPLTRAGLQLPNSLPVDRVSGPNVTV